MEKNSKEIIKKDAVDISKVYEIIKDKGFVQDLWLDVMIDLKEKPSYVKLKCMVEKIIETSVKNYATQPKDHEEKLKTRTTFTDLGIMTYTIDTLISDVLKKKLKDEIMSMISKVVDDHEHKASLENIDIKTEVVTMSKNVDDCDSNENLENADNKTEAVTMLENIGKLLCNGKDTDHKKPHGSDDTPGSSKRRLSKKVPSNQRGTKKKNGVNKEKNSSLLKNGNLSVTCSNIIDSKSRSSTKMVQYNSSKSGVIDVDVTKVSGDEDNYSIRSVSSVHTSDLSSFEDDISISSEDENGTKIKKRVSLKLAEKLYKSGRLSELHNKSHQRTEEQISSRSSDRLSVDSNSQRSSSRMRKPNSKYASDDVVCPMKLTNDSFVSDKEEILSTDVSEIHQSSSPNRSMKKHNEESKSNMNKRNSAQESESSDLSDDSLPPLPNFFETKKETPGKRGRPKKDKLLTEKNTPTTNEQKSFQNEKQTPGKKGRPKKDKLLTEKNTPTTIGEKRMENKVKRGKLSISRSEESVANKKQCVLDEMLPNLEKKLQLQTSASEQISQNVCHSKETNNDTEVKRKRGRPSNKSQNQMADEPNQHSVESFSKLEERLCIKENTVNSPLSPSKSAKSYDTSDLYKPRSDFKNFNKSGGSQAFTLFSN